MTKTKKTFVDKVRKNPWIFSTFVLAALVIVMAVTGFDVTGKTISADKAGHGFVDFINSRGGAQIEFVSVEEFSSDLYQVTVLADGNEVPAHITKDGKYFVQLVAPLEEQVLEEQQSTSAPEEPEVVKSDKPLVELFVMTHCPYGTQAEKGFLPALKAMKGVSDMKVRFVHYFMHGETEETETHRQVCIREEQPDKFISYLECFLEGDGNANENGYMANGNDPSSCMKKVGIDEAKVVECMGNGKAEEYYAVDSELSESYGVRGSPTVVVNGQIAQAGRSPQAYLDVTCSAFNDVPEVCGSISVSSETPTPGFGFGTTSSATTAQC